MTRDQARLKRFLNDLGGEVVAVIPNVSVEPFWAHRVGFLLVVERVPEYCTSGSRPGRDGSCGWAHSRAWWG